MKYYYIGKHIFSKKRYEKYLKNVGLKQSFHEDVKLVTYFENNKLYIFENEEWDKTFHICFYSERMDIYVEICTAETKQQAIIIANAMKRYTELMNIKMERTVY